MQMGSINAGGGGFLPDIFTGVKLTANHIIELNKQCGGENGKHDMKFSSPSVNDKVLFRMDCCRGYDIFYVSETIYFPPKGQFNADKISSIYIVDHKTDNTGGDSYILEGGVGQRSVEIELKSKFLRGYNFTILIFGKH